MVVEARVNGTVTSSLSLLWAAPPRPGTGGCEEEPKVNQVPAVASLGSMTFWIIPNSADAKKFA